MFKISWIVIWLLLILSCIYVFIYSFNLDNKTEHSKGIIPSRIVQYGIGGTATTLQFQILCVLMALLHEDEIENVGCYYNRLPAHKYCVIKTHVLKDSLLLQILPTDTWVFMTSSRNLSSVKMEEFERQKIRLRNMRIKIPFISDIETVNKLAHNIVFDYQQYFKISDSKMKHVVEYFRYWDIIRLCCGTQMSADWRMHLFQKKSYVPRHDPHSSSYPACEMYNLSVVEQLLMKTYVFQQFAKVPSLHDIIGKPSNVDGALDGSYCERCSRNIADKKLNFNDNCA